MIIAMEIDEAKATELWNIGLLDRDICERLGYNRKTFAKWRKNRGMASNKGVLDWTNATETTAGVKGMAL